MANTDFTGSYMPSHTKGGLVRHLVAMFLPSRSDRAASKTTGAALAGPLPGDTRARGYLDGLDIEVGF